MKLHNIELQEIMKLNEIQKNLQIFIGIHKFVSNIKENGFSKFLPDHFRYKISVKKFLKIS